MDSIEEVLHFSTSRGCLGILYTNALKARQRLENDPMVEFLFKPNARLRKDVAYLDYVNLSIEQINGEFYQICSNSWHRDEDIFWVILSFSPEILHHDGVVFATTNNIYTGVKRSSGEAGLDALYAEDVVQWNGRVVHRTAELPPSWPTCGQAEVLYPGEIDTSHLRCIYVRTEADRSEVLGFLRATWHSDVAVVVDPDRFQGRRA